MLGCAVCGVHEQLPLDAGLPERARPFLVTHAECVAFVDLNGASLLRAFAGA